MTDQKKDRGTEKIAATEDPVVVKIRGKSIGGSRDGIKGDTNDG